MYTPVLNTLNTFLAVFNNGLRSKNCNTGYGCFYAEASVSRKMLAGLKEKKETVKFGLLGSATSMSGGSLMGSELRNVPSGPDPLHHNRAPKKPISP
uniref:Uncharacterized protein n=1 Tax=Fagus sylvatica TaxID=28930 RepID=A0A2N9FNU6_FAGSY